MNLGLPSGWLRPGVCWRGAPGPDEASCFREEPEPVLRTPRRLRSTPLTRPFDEKSISRGQVGVACILRAVAGESVDLDRDPAGSGSRVDQVKRDVRAGGGE